MATGVHGTRVPSEGLARYYGERAAAGVGLVMHSVPVIPTYGRPSATYTEALPSFAAVARHVHSYGSRLFGQLYYYASSPGPWGPNTPPAPALSASATQRFDSHSVAHEMTIAGVQKLLDAFRVGARHLIRAGYDGIEIHAAHGTIVEHFVSPYFNKRRDGYGNDFTGRLRLLVEALEAVRDEAGEKAAVGLRLNCDERLPGGLTVDDATSIVDRLATRNLIDFADLDIGLEPEQFSLVSPTALDPEVDIEGTVAGIRQAVPRQIAVLVTPGRVTRLAHAERLIATGVTDMVGSVRGLIAEPELLKHAREGTEELSRTCIACNYCLASLIAGSGFGCAINPGSARETRWGLSTYSKKSSSRRVVVVGAGVAGLEAARVAAKCGHAVTLIEQRPFLGGQAALWSKLPGRDPMRTLCEWYATQVSEMGVEVRLGVRATTGIVLDSSPDAIVIASGARYATDGESGFAGRPIPGADREMVHTPDDLLQGDRWPAGRVIILDEEGLHTAAGIAELLAARGAEVELITRHQQPVVGLVSSFESTSVIGRLKNLGVRLTQGAYIKEIGSGEVAIYDVVTDAVEVRHGIEAVVLATMRRPEAVLAAELHGKVEQLFVIGDALAPRGLADAIFDGHKFARLIGEPGAARDFTDDFFRPLPDDLYAGMKAAATMAEDSPRN
jgi:2,4-dienoyl-CoA reductase-like NADH-dependent reductase (Old Yellow Enzyme family)